MCHMHNSAKESESNEEEINARFQLPKSFLCAQKTMMQLLHVNVSRIVKVWEILGVFIWVVWRFTTVKSRGIIFGIFVESIQKKMPDVNDKDWSSKEVHLRARIPISTDFRQIRSRDLPSGQLFPIDLSKPRVRKHILRTVLHVPVPLRRIALHQPHDQIPGVVVKLPRPPDVRWSTGDLFVQNDGVSFRLVVGRETGEHFENEDAEGIPVNGLVVSLLCNDLQKWQRFEYRPR
jgi:hypothetical protein